MSTALFLCSDSQPAAEPWAWGRYDWENGDCLDTTWRHGEV